MRILLDECLSQRLVPLLENSGHDVSHVADCGLAGRVDDDVLERARTEGRVLVPSDADFGEIDSLEVLPLSAVTEDDVVA